MDRTVGWRGSGGGARAPPGPALAGEAEGPELEEIYEPGVLKVLL